MTSKAFDRSHEMAAVRCLGFKLLSEAHVLMNLKLDTSYGFIIRILIRQSTNIVYIPYVRAPQGVST